MSSNGSRGDGAAVREFQTQDRTDRPRRDVEDRYGVIPASFCVVDKHTGQTIQIYQGVDAEARAEKHACHLRRRHRREAR